MGGSWSSGWVGAGKWEVGLVRGEGGGVKRG